MTDVLELLLELEWLQLDLVQHPLKVDSEDPYMKVLEALLNIMGMITKSIISKECSAHLEQISSGGMISTNT